MTATTALELGVGSGVVLAAMVSMGADRGVGVDLEAFAVEATRRLLDSLGLAARARVLQGDLWTPLADERFDLIASNLPQFPQTRPLDDGRLPTWSGGGPDGRAVLDRFLDGLPRHLAPGGRAVITHNAFIDLPRTLQRLAADGLEGEVAQTVSVPLPLHKLEALPPGWFERWDGRGLHRIGGHAFADFHVLEIRHRERRT